MANYKIILVSLFVSTSGLMIEDVKNQVAFEKVGEMASSTSFAHLGFRLHLPELFDRLNKVALMLETTDSAATSLDNRTDVPLIRHARHHLKEETVRLKMLIHMATKEAQLKVYESIEAQGGYNFSNIFESSTQSTSSMAKPQRDRVKRSSLLGVGTVLSFGLGAYNSIQIQRISSAIKRNDARNHLVTEMLMTEGARINRLINRMNWFNNVTIELASRIEEIGLLAVLQSTKEELMELYILSTEMVQDYRLGIEHLAEHRVSPNFLQPESVERSFNNIRKKAK
ncbi:Hypothetical predicted protein, partial [Paramuricea clavata]